MKSAFDCFKDVKEFQAEVSAAKSRQADSIFYKRTDTTSAEQYFQAGLLMGKQCISG